jgi:hypothetical protein
MRDTARHRKRVILWEWVSRRGEGVMSGADLAPGQQAKLDERLDRIEELTHLDHETIAGYIFPFDKELKKMKIPGSVALRPVLVLGPFDKRYELTFLLVAREENRQLKPSKRRVAETARERLADIMSEPRRRIKYERD